MFVDQDTQKKMRAHVKFLCDQFSIERTVKKGRGHAKVRLRKIQHAPIEWDEMAYYVALHEIGHVVIGRYAPRLEREALSWEWALQQSLFYPHYSTRQRICALLVRYLYRASDNGWEFPDKDSAYWRLFRWWEVEDGT